MPTPDPSKEIVFLATPTAGGRGNLIASPFQFLMTGEDMLVVTGWSDDATIVIAVHGRFLKDTGEIQPFVYRCPTAATVAGQVTALPLGKGFLLNLALVIDAGGASVAWGRAYGRVDVVRGTVGPRIILGSLLAGYVTSGPILAWPGSPIINPWEGAGFLEWRNMAGGGTNSATLTAGTIVRWEIHGATCVFSTAAPVVTRRPFVSVLGGPGLVAKAFLPVGVGPATFVDCYWHAGLGGIEERDRTEAVGSLPAPLWVLPTFTLNVSADNVQIADTVTTPRALLRQFLSIP